MHQLLGNELFLLILGNQRPLSDILAQSGLPLYFGDASELFREVVAFLELTDHDLPGVPLFFTSIGGLLKKHLLLNFLVSQHIFHMFVQFTAFLSQ
jgi:hypothetical protein